MSQTANEYQQNLQIYVPHTKDTCAYMYVTKTQWTKVQASDINTIMEYYVLTTQIAWDSISQLTYM